MRTIKITVTDEELEQLETIRQDQEWREFFLILIHSKT